MTGAGFALLAALAYGFAGVTISRAKATARGDNGVFLSVLATASLTCLLWLGWGQTTVESFRSPESLKALAIFALAGFFSTVLGRVTMYRATERLGAVATGLLRRLTPLFALPLAILLLAEVPDAATLLGGAIVLVSVVLYLGVPSPASRKVTDVGLWLGVGSAACYAAAYSLRSLGLDSLPDAALGTFIGALTGCLWFLVAAILGSNWRLCLRRLFLDRGPWHCLTALALSAGQTLQFFALKSAPVVVVATLGTLEVFFAALFGAIFLKSRVALSLRLVAVLALASAGTALLVG